MTIPARQSQRGMGTPPEAKHGAGTYRGAASKEASTAYRLAPYPSVALVT
jgi:hypothetical protein